MYLKTLVRLFDGNGPVTTMAITKELSVMNPPASTMLKRLDAVGFVTHERRRRRGPDGTQARTMRRLLTEWLLVEHLGIPRELAASEACRLEHSISTAGRTRAFGVSRRSALACKSQVQLKYGRSSKSHRDADST
jgi:Mn-dependent DtxR family transcriptional regulator